MPMKQFISRMRATHGLLVLVGPLFALGACLNSSTPTTETGGKKSGGAIASGGNAAGSGGNSVTEKGGSGGASSTGGAVASGGSAGSGGAAGSGGSTTASGGAVGDGGSSASGGTGGSGGRPGTGGGSGSGGLEGSGGIPNLGGTQSAGESGRDAGPDLSADTNRSTGGRARDGSATGGSATGGSGTGGSGKGGSGAGGSGTGGVASGGSTGSTIADGCTDELAKGIAISEIAVFQAGKISVMKNATAATPKTAQGAEIIQGKDALFRVYVTTDSGFQSRALSARLLVNGGSLGYSAKATISASSTELATANSFTIPVPASAITASLDYQVQIVECATGSGTDHSPSFPASGVASLATRKTGPEKLTLVPVTSGGVTPTLDQTFSDSIKNYFDSMYPTSGTQITLNSTPVTGCEITATTAMDDTAWSNCLNNVLTRRRSDKPANDVYYVGVVTPTSTFSTYCTSSCIMGISPVASVSSSNSRASLIVGYSPYAPSTAAHEVGHAHGLQHSPGCGAAQPDSKFPYVTSGKAYIGWVGWDKQQSPVKLYDPAKYTDIMAYCSPQWVSDYVFKELADRIVALDSSEILAGPARTWRMAFESSSGIRWGTPVTDPIPAEGQPMAASVLDAQGRTIAETTVYRTPTSTGGAIYMVPDPASGWAAITIGGRGLAF
jgi:hypothetical protein